MVMIRAQNWWSHSRKAVLIWVSSFTLFFCLFRMALRSASPIHLPHSDPFVSYLEQSSRLYDKMARDLEDNGPKFLKQGETSQSLSISELFSLKDGFVTPVLKAADPPVRANVLHLSTEYSIPISEAVKRVFSPYFDKAIWFQDSDLYHFSLFHASHHISSVPATESEIEDEATAVKAVANELCPFEIVLDRVILTSTGVLLGCWKAISRTDPVMIRSRLRTALPRAPEKQLYDAVILHTSLARLLGPPKSSDLESSRACNHLELLQELVARLNSEIQGFKAKISELWFVEEYDVLALALNGRMKVRKFPLGCPRS